ncbi:MAG TPA: M28 family peptidase [Leptospiraceae bacterium]|nr:M28 family peptidase [Leptospiraceae bacterium]HNN01961.1 M28 family peptidase [Leptospiraceae bacterium]
MKLLCFLLLSFSVPIISENNDKILSNRENLRRHIVRLTSTESFRNFENIRTLNSAGDYIFDELKKTGLSPERQRYSVRSKTVFNVNAEIKKSESLKTILIGAHYDAAGNQDGADDNASGTAGLLELARILKSSEKSIHYNIIFSAFTLEEPPFFRTEQMGSYIHARSLFQSGRKIDLMISLEMIGYYSDQENSQEYPSFLMKPFYPSKGNFLAGTGRGKEKVWLKKILKAYEKYTDLPFEYLSTDLNISGTDFSDHLNYWKFNYPAIMITDTSFLRNPNYHEQTDTVDTLDFSRMKKAVDGLYFFLSME